MIGATSVPRKDGCLTLPDARDGLGRELGVEAADGLGAETAAGAAVDGLAVAAWENGDDDFNPV